MKTFLEIIADTAIRYDADLFHDIQPEAIVLIDVTVSIKAGKKSVAVQRLRQTGINDDKFTSVFQADLDPAAGLVSPEGITQHAFQHAITKVGLHLTLTI